MSMRLLEAIVDANSRSGGKVESTLKPEAHAGALPLVVLSCVDPRLNQKLPEALGLPEDQVVWLRNAGNVITGPLSSTMRSLALACLVKRGREVVVVGHTDCRVAQTSVLELTDAMKELGLDRHRLPENLVEFFGLFSSERQNVIRSVEFVRQSPLISPKLPVHGLLIHTDTGRLEWVVNGYQTLETAASSFQSTIRKPEMPAHPSEEIGGVRIGGAEFPSLKIGDTSPIGEITGTTPAQPKAPTAENPAAAPAASGAPAGDKTRLTLGQRIGERVGQTVAEKVTEFLEAKMPQAETAADVVEALLKKIDPSRRYLLIGSDQKRYGPVSGRIVQQWLSDNRIDGNTPIQIEGSSSWQSLRNLPDPASVRLPPPIPTGERRRGH